MKILLWLKCTTAMQSLFLYSNLFLSVKLDSLPYSFTPISFFEDTWGIIWIRKSKKDRQHNRQKDKQRSTKHYIENKRSHSMNPTKNHEWTRVLQKSGQWYSYSCTTLSRTEPYHYTISYVQKSRQWYSYTCTTLSRTKPYHYASSYVQVSSFFYHDFQLYFFQQ